LETFGVVKNAFSQVLEVGNQLPYLGNRLHLKNSNSRQNLLVVIDYHIQVIDYPSQSLLPWSTKGWVIDNHRVKSQKSAFQTRFSLNNHFQNP